MVDYTSDLKETLDKLRRTNLKLNPTKYTFRVSLEKFLGHVISSRGLQANPEKVNILAKMRSLRTLREVQTLTRRLAALERLLSRSFDK